MMKVKLKKTDELAGEDEVAWLPAELVKKGLDHFSR